MLNSINNQQQQQQQQDGASTDPNNGGVNIESLSISMHHLRLPNPPPPPPHKLIRNQQVGVEISNTKPLDSLILSSSSSSLHQYQYPASLNVPSHSTMTDFIPSVITNQQVGVANDDTKCCNSQVSPSANIRYQYSGSINVPQDSTVSSTCTDSTTLDSLDNTVTTPSVIRNQEVGVASDNTEGYNSHVLSSANIQYQYPGWLSVSDSTLPSTSTDHTTFTSLYPTDSTPSSNTKAYNSHVLPSLQTHLNRFPGRFNVPDSTIPSTSSGFSNLSFPYPSSTTPSVNTNQEVGVGNNITKGYTSHVLPSLTDQYQVAGWFNVPDFSIPRTSGDHTKFNFLHLANTPSTIRNQGVSVENNNTTGYTSHVLPSLQNQYRFPGQLNVPADSNTSTSSTDRANFSLLYPANIPQHPDLYHSNQYNLPETSTPSSGCFANGQQYPFDISNLFLDKKMMVIFAKDCRGSSFLQDLLEPGSYITSKIIEAMVSYSYELICDSFGSLFFMKLLQVSDDDQKDRVLSFLVQDEVALVSACCHRIGVQVIKLLIKTSKKIPAIESLPKVLSLHVMLLATDQTGKYVIMECFRRLGYMEKLPLYGKIMDHWMSLAIDQHGCLTLCECLKNMELVYMNHIALGISNQAALLSQDKYGSFMIQYVLNLNDSTYATIIVKELKSLYKRLSTTQNGSYIVQQCLRTLHLSDVVAELLHSTTLLYIAKNPFGNYVVQCALQETKEHETALYEKLCEMLYQNLSQLQFNLFGKKIVTMLDKQMGEERFGGLQYRP